MRSSFLFIFQVINISKESGFLNGLYDGTELNPKEIKDKNMKLNWMNKLVDAVGLFWGMVMNAKGKYKSKKAGQLCANVVL